MCPVAVWLCGCSVPGRGTCERKLENVYASFIIYVPAHSVCAGTYTHHRAGASSCGGHTAHTDTHAHTDTAVSLGRRTHRPSSHGIWRWRRETRGASDQNHSGLGKGEKTTQHKPVMVVYSHAYKCVGGRCNGRFWGCWVCSARCVFFGACARESLAPRLVRFGVCV